MPAKRKNFYRFSKLSNHRWNKKKCVLQENNDAPDCSRVIGEEGENHEWVNPMNERIRNTCLESEIPISETKIIQDEYVVFQSSLLRSLLGAVLCKICLSDRLDIHISDGNCGFVKKVEVMCKNCAESGLDATLSSTFTSSRINHEDRQKPGFFEVNLRIVMAFLQFGRSYAAVEQFAMMMNMCPFSKSTFFVHMEYVSESMCGKIQEILKAARSSVKNAYLELGILIQPVVNATVSFDGTWLTRGHTSMFGVGCAIDVVTGYVIDFEIMSKYCHECVMAKIDLGEESPEYNFWLEGHKSTCQVNHFGSSGAMEMAAAAEIWQRSEKYGFRCTTLLSDGDAKTLQHLNKLQVHGKDIIVEKEECINHVKKRLGTGLRELIKIWQNRGVTLGGRAHGFLKATTTDKVCNYYKVAIYRNKGNVEAMKTAILATIYHGVSTDRKPQHQYCPIGEDSWCFYQAATAKGQKPGLHMKEIRTPINETVFEKILPIYKRLSDEELLRRCAQCRTQNANESLHSLIWNKFPKESFVSKKRLLIAVAEAIAEYNNGCLRTAAAMQTTAGLSSGSMTNIIAHRRDQRRAKAGKARNSAINQKIRRSKKLIASRIEQALKESEGVTYKAGGF